MTSMYKLIYKLLNCLPLCLVVLVANTAACRADISVFIDNTYIETTFETFFLDGEPSGGNTQNSLRLAQQYSLNGENDKALALYKEIYNKNKDKIVYSAYLNLLLDNEDLKAAEKLIIRQIKYNESKSLDAYVSLCKIDLADVYIKNNQVEKGEKLIDKTIDEVVSGSNIALSEISDYLIQKTSTYQHSINIYQKAREFAQLSQLYAFELATLHRLSGDIENMLNEYIIVLETSPNMEENVKASIQSTLSTEVDKTNNQTQKEIKKLLYQKVQNKANNRVLQNLLIWILIQEHNYEEAFSLAKTYPTRFNDDGEKLFSLAKIAFDNKFYTEAERIFKYVMEAGNINLEKETKNNSKANNLATPSIGIYYINQSEIELLNLYFNQLKEQKVKDISKAISLKEEYKKLLDEMFGSDNSYVELLRNLSNIYAYYTNNIDSAVLVLEKIIETPSVNKRTKAEVKIDLADILLFAGQNWNASLLYAQVEKDFKQDAIGFYAKFKNAELFYYIAEFQWAKSQLDVLKASTTKLIANDAMDLSLLISENNNEDSTYIGLSYFAKADFMAYRNLYTNALNLLDSILTMPTEYELYDDVYMSKADIYIALDSPYIALEMLEHIYTNFNDGLFVDDAYYKAGEIYYNNFLNLIKGEPIGAKHDANTTKKAIYNLKRTLDVYEKLFLEFRGSGLAKIAREKYRLIHKQHSQWVKMLEQKNL